MENEIVNKNCCNKRMKGLYCWDDAQETDHAFNLYVCEECGGILKESVWEDKCVITISQNNTITKV